MRGLAIVCMVVASGVAGCADNPSRKGRTAASWTASAEMVGAAWLEGRVPTRYAVRTLEKAAREVEPERGTDPAMARSIDELRAAIAAQDRAAARRSLDDVAAKRAVLGRRAAEARS